MQLPPRPAPTRPATSPRSRVLALALVAAVGLAACGGGDSSESDAPVAPQGDGFDAGGAQTESAEGGEAPASDEGADAGDPGAGEAETPEAAANRQLIYRATIGLASDDPDDTVEQVEAATASAGGFVAGTQLRRDELDLLRGSITIRVPAGNLDQLLADVAATAEVTSRDQTVEDVTGQVADIQSRLRNLRALEEELLVLLTEAREGGDTEDVLAVFDRVGQVREEIELLEGRRADLGDQVALSTLTVQVEPSRALVESRTSEPDDDLPLPWSPGNVTASAWDATVGSLQAFVDTVIRVVVFMLPVLLVWLSPVWLVLGAYLLWRRRRRRSSEDPTGGTTRPTPAEPHDPDDDQATHEVDGRATPPAAPRVGAGTGDRRDG